MNPTKKLKMKNTKIATHLETYPEQTQGDEAGPGEPSPSLACYFVKTHDPYGYRVHGSALRGLPVRGLLQGGLAGHPKMGF